jgi:hypothetical protein
MIHLRLSYRMAIIAMGLALAACEADHSSLEPNAANCAPLEWERKAERSTYFNDDVLARFEASDDRQRYGMNRVAWRDSTIADHVAVVDSNYETFKCHLFKEMSINATTTPKALLPTASLGGVGARAAWKPDTIYQILQAILAQMNARRMAVLVRIRTLQLKDSTAYPLAQALADIADYRQAGTIPTAIQAIVDDATRMADMNEQILARIPRVPR